MIKLEVSAVFKGKRTKKQKKGCCEDRGCQTVGGKCLGEEMKL